MVQSKLELTPRGQASLLLINLTAGAAWLTSDLNAQLATGMLGSVFLIDWALKRFRPPRIEALIKPRRTRTGSLFLETLELRNLSTSFSAHHLSLSEPRFNTLEGGAYIEEILPGRSSFPRVPGRSRRRNRIRKRTFYISTSHPFGMFRWSCVLEQSTDLISEPARIELDRNLIEASGRGSQALDTGQRNSGGEFFSLREYQDGDDARHVHAARSARVGSLISKNLRGDHDPEIAVVLDFRRQPGSLVPISSHDLEHHLSTAASLIDLLITRSRRLHCYTLDGANQHWVIDSEQASRDLFALLAEARAVPYYHLNPSDLPDFITALSCIWIPAGGYQSGKSRQSLDGIYLTQELGV